LAGGVLLPESDTFVELSDLLDESPDEALSVLLAVEPSAFDSDDLAPSPFDSAEFGSTFDPGLA
jgi:hypothetical protein